MGIPARHAEAPHIGGETLTADALETDVYNMIFEFGLIPATPDSEQKATLAIQI